MIFNSQIIDLGPFKADWPENVVKNEPMFFNCSVDFAYYWSGPITKAFIEALPNDWKNEEVVIDSRVHMLMPGWYPCIPGYHHDDVPRRKDGNKQPDYQNMAYKAEHLMGLVNGDICPTKFAIGQCEVSIPEDDEVIYKKWHFEIEECIQKGSLLPLECPSGRLIQFNWETFHSGQKARKNGWRWFCRVSRNTDRTKSITNEIRRQTQCYLENPVEGW